MAKQKRHVLKNNQQNTSVVSATQDNDTLYTTSNNKRETFVGAKGNVLIDPSGTAGGSIAIVLHQKREGTDDPTLSVTSGQQISDRMQDVLWSWIHHVDADVDDLVSIPLDVRSKRKMKEGDSLVMSTKASGSGIGTVISAINNFIMEA